MPSLMADSSIPDTLAQSRPLHSHQMALASASSMVWRSCIFCFLREICAVFGNLIIFGPRLGAAHVVSSPPFWALDFGLIFHFLRIVTLVDMYVLARPLIAEYPSPHHVGKH